MSIDSVLSALQNSAVAHSISKSNHLVGAALQIVHVLGFIALLAAVVLISLRLLNLVLRQQPLSDVTRDAHRLLYVGLGLTIASGLLMFITTPRLYISKFAFLLKMGLFVAALVLQFALFRRVVALESPSPALARATVTLSLLAWFGIGFAGRMIGFT